MAVTFWRRDTWVREPEPPYILALPPDPTIQEVLGTNENFWGRGPPTEFSTLLVAYPASLWAGSLSSG